MKITGLEKAQLKQGDPAAEAPSARKGGRPKMGLTKIGVKYLNLVKNNAGITVAQAREVMGGTTEANRHQLCQLVKLGLVVSYTPQGGHCTTGKVYKAIP